VFLDKSKRPTPEALADALGPAYALWNRVAVHVVEKQPHATEEWKFSGAQTGWSFRLKDAKRVIVYMLPGDRSFRVSFAFGDEAASAVEVSALPAPLKEELRTAKRYAEGRGLRMDVRGRDDASHAETLIDIKIAH
jgi:hypothetical protein